MSDINDDELLSALQDAVASADPPPDGLRDAALRALTWDTGLERLSLLYDSLTEQTDMRSDLATRDLSFGRDQAIVEIAISAGERGTTVLDGSVDPDVVAAHLVRPGADEQPLEVDQHGRFRSVVTGSVAGLRLTTADGTTVRTELFSLDPRSD